MNAFIPAETWLKQAQEPDAEFRSVLQRTYRGGDFVVRKRLQLLQKAARFFLERFGNLPIRVFRAPGRLNLRGMHVDTHGGYLNLITHQRETLVLCAAVESPRCVLANLNSSYQELSLLVDSVTGPASHAPDWDTVLSHRGDPAHTQKPGGHWGNYVQGVIARVSFAAQRSFSRGFYAVVASDLPSGAGLSSSHSLCTSLLYAMASLYGVPFSDEEKILAVRDAEWYAGARSGVSDQGAMILCKDGELVNVPLFAQDLRLDSVRRTRLSDDTAILVVNSLTSRSLSGEQLVEYSKNRFAYSLAMEVIRQELLRQGIPEDFVITVDRLARLSPAYLKPYGGLRFLYSLLRTVPEQISLDALKSRYQLKNIEETLERYFGPIPREKRPSQIDLRGPLLFGIAESERARIFFDTIASGDLINAGRLMSLGHDGDRRIDSHGRPFHEDISDARLADAQRKEVPIEQLSGSYGASSPALDQIVDCALQYGAFGACLTGAGIAGSVIALCLREEAARIGKKLQDFLSSDNYADVARIKKNAIPEEVWESAVQVNCPTAGAGELVLNYV